MKTWFLPLAGSPTVKSRGGRKDERGKTLHTQAGIDSCSIILHSRFIIPVCHSAPLPQEQACLFSNTTPPRQPHSPSAIT